MRLEDFYRSGTDEHTVVAASSSHSGHVIAAM
jgi:hypothetical protein